MAEYIEKQAALDIVNGWRDQLIPTYGENDEYVKCLETVAEHLELLHAADIQPVRRGRWEQTGGKYSRHKTIDRRILTCSVCGNFLYMEGVNAGRGDANFCPNCGSYNGADMRGGDAE